MAYDEEEQRRSRVVVETPTQRREVVQTETTRVPEKTGPSTGAIAAMIIGAVALTAIVFMFVMNGNDTTNTNERLVVTPTPAMAPSTTIIQQPATAPPPTTTIIQAPPVTTTQPAPIIMAPPVDSSTAAAPTPSVPDDATLETDVNQKLMDDTELSTSGITVKIAGGKATLAGSVTKEDLKRRAERLARTVKGVRRIDNQIIVSEGMTPRIEP